MSTEMMNTTMEPEVIPAKTAQKRVRATKAEASTNAMEMEEVVTIPAVDDEGDEETQKKRRTRKPAMTTQDAFEKFESGELNGIVAEYGDKRLRAVFINVEGQKQAFAPADPGKPYSMQSYEQLKNSINILSQYTKVKVMAF